MSRSTSATWTLDFLVRANAALAATVPGGHLLIETTQLRPDALAKTYVQAPIDSVRFAEDPDLRGAFSGRYTLAEGAWPQSPFDVVVSQHLLDALPDPAAFTVLSGRATLKVVGVVVDGYAKHADTIVAGAGTWESIVAPPLGRLYQPVEAKLTVLFGAGTPVADVGRALQAVLPPLSPDEGDRASIVDANYSTRSQVAGLPVTEFGSDQIVVSHLPLLMVVLLAAALVVGRTRRGHGANADRLVAVGVRRSVVVSSQVVALSIVTAGSIAAGLGVGWLFAVALRAGPLPSVAEQPLSPLPGLDRPTLAVVASCLVLIAAGTVWPAGGNDSRRWSVVSRWSAAIHIELIRRVSVVLLLVGALKVGGSATSVVGSYLAVAAVLLAAPDLLRVVIGCLPCSNARTFVVRRLMRDDLGRQSAAIVVIGCCLALPICTATQLASKERSDGALTYSRVPARQIWVQNDGGTGDVTGVATVVSRVQGVGEPVVVRDLTSSPGPQGEAGPSSLFLQLATTGSSSLEVIVVDSAAQLRRLVGDDLPDNAATTLDAGGVLDFTSAVGDQQLVVYSADGDRLLVTPVLPTLKVALDRQLSSQLGGAVLLSTAQQLQLPVSDPIKYIYPGVSTAVIGAAVQAAVDAGYDSEFVQYAVPPPPPHLPASAYIFLAGLVLGGFAVLVLVIRGQARRLRSYTSRLVAIGLGPRWILSLLGIQTAVLVGLGVLVGVFAGVLGVEITADSYVVLEAPVRPIALSCLATIMAAALATALAVRALTAAEHAEVN